MADIKNLGIFGNSNKGLDKIRQQTKAKNNNNTAAVSPEISNSLKETSEGSKKASSSSKIAVPKNKNGRKGAPITKFDRVYSAKQALKLSPLTNSTASIMVEKYETNITKDELLRKALNGYIKQNLSLEDKQDLLNSVMVELKLFREQYPTVPELDSNGNVVRTVEEIEQQTLEDLYEQWGINRKNRI
jgi:hypothetical protein